MIEHFTQKIVSKFSKIWVWDPGSEIRDSEKTYSGSRIQGSKMHRIPDLDPQHCNSRMIEYWQVELTVSHHVFIELVNLL